MSDHKVDAAAIERPIRQRMLVWFAVVSGLLIAAGSISFYRLRSAIESFAEVTANGVVDGVTNQLLAADSIYRDLTEASVREIGRAHV